MYKFLITVLILLNLTSICIAEDTHTIPSVPIENGIYMLTKEFEKHSFDMSHNSNISYRYSPDGTYILYFNSNLSFKDLCNLVYNNKADKKELLDYYELNKNTISIIGREEARQISNIWSQTTINMELAP